MTAQVTTAAAERMSALDAEFFFAEHGNVPLPSPARERRCWLVSSVCPATARA